MPRPGARLPPHRCRCVCNTHTNTIENAFSLLKRGLIGTFHKVSIKHLERYLNEFSYRFNRRKAEAEMFSETVRTLLNRIQLSYSKLTGEATA